MNKLTLIIASASLLALTQPVAAQPLLKATPQTSQRVSVNGKTVNTVGVELAQAARQVCAAALKGGRKNLEYASCVTETLGQARADYFALRSTSRAPIAHAS